MGGLKLAAAGGAAGAACTIGGPAAAQVDQFTVSGSGVNVKEMPGADGKPVPLRESFAFNAHYAQCLAEDNPAAFVMPTFTIGFE